jgi:TonB family protein
MKLCVILKLIVVIAVVFQSTAFGQDLIVTGKVQDSKGNKAVGATIVIKGTTIGTVSDMDGLFSIKVPTEKVKLRITHYSTSQVWEDSFEAGKDYVIKLTSDSPAELFDFVEENPIPATGKGGWNHYLARNIKYPLNDREAGVEGTVIVGFEVHSDGSVHNVEVLRGIGGECDQEAVRVISSGPSWTPGRIGDEAVNTRMSIPIQFKLNGSTSPSKSKEAAIAKLYGEDHLVVVGYTGQASR